MDIKQETKNKWGGIMAALGIDVGFAGKHTACPMCGGKDRFRFDDKNGNGTWICNQCGAGDGFSLVEGVLDTDFKGAVKVVKGVLGHVDTRVPPQEPTITREALRSIYTESKRVVVGDPVDRYLANRGINARSDKLRYHPSCFEPETHKNVPAMLAAYSLADSTAITMHRTFLTRGGNKANINNPKKLLPAIKPMRGGAIRLFEPHHGMVAVSEGIETALAVYELTNLPCWAVVSSALMQNFEPPSHIKHVMIFGDNDENFTGQMAAYTLANRLSIQKKIITEVYIPKNVGDYLNELNKKKLDI